MVGSSLSESFELLGSSWSPDTATPLIAIPAESASTKIVISTLAPFPMAPKVQVTTPPDSEHDP